MPEYDLNLRDYLRILYKRRLTILLVFIIVTLGSYFYISREPEVYESSSTVKVLERQSIAGILTEWIVYSPADVMASNAKIITGFPIMKKVALHLRLIDENLPVSDVQDIVADLQSRVRTLTIERTNIIEITAKAGRPKEAMDLANAVAYVTVEENLLEKKRQASAARRFIEEQLTQLDERLRKGEEQLRNISDEVQGVRLAEPIQKALIDLEFKLATYLQRYTSKHPQVTRLKEEIKNLENKLSGFSGVELDYARLVREVEVNKSLYAMLKEKLEEARISEAQKVGDISIVDPAVMPRSPVAPKKSTGIAIGAILGLILGFFLAVMLENLDTSLGTIEDIESIVKLPVLGVVPSISRSPSGKESIFQRFKQRFLAIKKEEKEESYIRLIVHHEPKSYISEAYRNIRTNLKLSPSKKTILITSAGPREGKTTILINLGLAIAQKGEKVLLVSSDLRRPAIAKSFGIDKEPGLNEIVMGTQRLDDVLRNVTDIMLGVMQFDEIVKTPGIENIWILTCGSLPANPAETLESKTITNLIEELRKRFDIILFDSPPVLPVTDASLLAPKVDSVVLCYEMGRTSRDALLRAKIQLESTGANISGVVLNHIAAQSEIIEPYPYYYTYKYRYYSEKENKSEDKDRKLKAHTDST